MNLRNRIPLQPEFKPVVPRSVLATALIIFAVEVVIATRVAQMLNLF